MTPLITKAYLPFFVFLLLSLVMFPFSFDTATSVVPGWHTSILSPYATMTSIYILVLCLVTIAYWVLARRNKKVNLPFFIIHFLLTIPIFIYLLFPGILFFSSPRSGYEMGALIERTARLMLLAMALFALGQVLFFIYFIRSMQEISK
jgi:hypothetical protein